jgi:hypothetical protein
MSADKQVAAPVPREAAVTPSIAQSCPAESMPQEIPPEILTVIQTAAAVFVAKHTQSEKAEPALDKSWSIKGREIAQASHNLVQRGH